MTLYVAYDGDRIIRRIRDSQTAIDALAAADAALTAHTGGFADTTLVDVGWYLGTNNLPTAVLPAALLWAEEQKALKRSVAQAFRTYEHGQAPGSRQASWPNRAADQTIAQDALLATDRWVLHQVGIADRIIDRVLFAALTTAQAAALVEHINTILRTLGEVWYGEMKANAAPRNNWKAVSIAASAVLYSDIVTTLGAARSPDGSFTALPALMPAGLVPDSDTLR